MNLLPQNTHTYAHTHTHTNTHTHTHTRTHTTSYILLAIEYILIETNKDTNSSKKQGKSGVKIQLFTYSKAHN